MRVFAHNNKPIHYEAVSMIFQRTAIIAAAMAISTAVSAAETVRVAAGLSTFGPTVEAQVPVADNITIRGSLAGGLSATGTTTADGLDYSVDATLGATTLMATYHLPAGVRLSGGVLMSNTSINGSVSGSAGDVVGGYTIPAGQTFTVSSTTEFANSISPMATIGFDTSILGMVLSSDIGIVQTGGFDVSLAQTAGTATIPAGDLTTAETNIQSELSQYDIVPYFSLMVGKWF